MVLELLILEVALTDIQAAATITSHYSFNLSVGCLRVFVCLDISLNATEKKHWIKAVSTFIIWQGKSKRSDWFFLGRDFAIRTVS